MSRRPRPNCYFPGWESHIYQNKEKKNEEAAHGAMQAAEAAEMAAATYAASAEQGSVGLGDARAAKDAWAAAHDEWDKVQEAEPRGLTKKVCSPLHYPTVRC